MKRFKAWLLAGALLPLVLGCGCGPQATAPQTAGVATAPATSDVLIGRVGSFGSVMRGLNVRTRPVLGLLPAQLANGRWSVAIPAGAIQGAAQVGIGVVGPSSGECQLEIVPATKNKFEIPVTVTVDCTGVDDATLSTWVIYWSDPVAHRWVKVEGSTVDLSAHTVSAPLDHFSRYSVGPDGGKAGW